MATRRRHAGRLNSGPGHHGYAPHQTACHRRHLDRGGRRGCAHRGHVREPRTAKGPGVGDRTSEHQRRLGSAWGRRPSSSAPAATGAPASSDLGDQSDPAALVAALRNLESHGGSVVAETILSPPACASTRPAGAGLPSDSRALVAADVRWKGQDAQALVFADSTRTNGQTAVVVTPTDCAVLTSIPF